MRALAVIAALAASATIAGATSAAAGTAAANASLRLVAKEPLTLRGAAFKARERVRVTAAVGDERAVRVVRASARGAFTVVFPTLGANDPCVPITAAAAGIRGSRASFKLPQLFSERICPIP